MRNHLLSGVLVAATLAWTVPAAAQQVGTATPGDTAEQRAASPRSDQNAIDRGPVAPNPAEQRLVGKVLEVDRDQGVVVLATKQGVVVVQATPESLADIDVGDVIAVVVRPLPPPERV